MQRLASRAAIAFVAAMLVSVGTVAVAPAQVHAATGVASVFYSGAGCAGLPQAGAASRRLREQAGPCVPGWNGGTGYYNGRWASGNCEPSHATYPETIGGRKVTQLVGFSLGRLGPLYLLRQSDSLAANVNNIVLLDPGSSEITGNRCDTKFQSSDNLKKWLARSTKNRLVIVAGPDTSANNYDGINSIYLKSVSASVRSSQVLVCKVDLKHSDVMAKYGPMLIGKSASTSCPDGSTRDDQQDTTPSGGTGPGAPPPPSQASIRITWSTSHPSWIVMTLTGFTAGTYRYTCQFASGGPSTYTLTASGTPQTFDTGHTCFDSIPGDRVWVTIGQIASNSITVGAQQAPTPAAHRETVGGATHTWTNYANAGGTQGSTIPAYSTVDISCVTQGFRVANGNTNWYRIASSPWNNAYYASADAFYNNGATAGSLHGTPYADPAVPAC